MAPTLPTTSRWQPWDPADRLDRLGVEAVTATDVPDLVAPWSSPGRAPNVVRLRIDDLKDLDDLDNLEDVGGLTEPGVGAHLGRADVVLRPTWVQWLRRTGSGAQDLIGTQSARRRRNSRRSLRELRGLHPELCAPVTAVRLQEWSRLYAANLRGMRHGVNFAALSRSAVLAPGSGHELHAWRDDDGELVAGVVTQTDGPRSVLTARFVAVTPWARSQDLTTAVYLHLADVAAQRSITWFSLGHDLNFYGSCSDPGLAVFKLRFGMHPVPAGVLSDVEAVPVAERLLSTAGLQAPVLRLAYPGVRPVHLDAAELDDVAGLLELVVAGEVDPELQRQLPPRHRVVRAELD